MTLPHTNRTSWLYYVVTLFISVLILASCGDGYGVEKSTVTTISPAGGEAKSADGKLTLIFPAGAVGVDTEITITPASADSLGSDFDEIVAEDVYELQPDGLTFAQPIAVKLVPTRQPQVSGGVVTSRVQFLASDSSAGGELLQNITPEVTDDGKISLSGELSHFSSLLVFDSIRPLGNDSVVIGSGIMQNFPSSSLVEQRFRLSFTANSTVADFDDTGFQNDGFDDQDTNATPLGVFNLDFPDGFGSNLYFPASGEGNGPRSRTVSIPDVYCEKGPAAYVISRVLFVLRVDIDSISTASVRKLFESSTIVEGGNIAEILAVIPKQTGQCTVEDEPPTTEAILREGAFALGNLIEAAQPVGEQIGNLRGPGSGSSKVQSKNSGSDSLLFSIATGAGSVVLDIVSGDILFGSADTDPPQSGIFGQVGISQPNPGPNTPAGLFEYGSKSSPFGGFLRGYDTAEQTFGGFGQLISGSFTDAFPSGGNVVSDEMLACSGEPVIIAYDASLQSYQQVLDENSSAETFDVGRTCVSLIAASAGGPVLSVSKTSGRFTDSRLYFTDRSGDATEVGVVGVDARRIRHKGDIAAITLFEDDAIKLALWDGQNAPTLVEGTISVGDGPVDLDIRTTATGNTQIVTTGFNDDTITVTEVDSAGALQSNTNYQAPEGCLAPAHASFIENAENETDPYIVGTCFDSGNYFVFKESSLSTPALE